MGVCRHYQNLNQNLIRWGKFDTFEKMESPNFDVRRDVFMNFFEEEEGINYDVLA